MNKTFISLFGGVGGFDIALIRNGWQCVGYYEIDKYAVQTYNKNFGTKYKPTDVTTISAESVPDHEMLCAGVPCQAWSIAGKRKGFEDARGTLWYEVFRITKEKKPKYLLLENVKGILSHNNGKSFEQICECICELGYVIDFTVLNSKFFGVPQSRERIFILARRIETIDRKKII